MDRLILDVITKNMSMNKMMMQIMLQILTKNMTMNKIMMMQIMIQEIVMRIST